MRPDDTVYLGHYEPATCCLEEAFVVMRDGDLLDPGPSQCLHNHSPDGFAWGYLGSGAKQLALALLLDFTGYPPLAVWHAPAFLQDCVGGFCAEGGWTLWGGEVRAWLDAAQARNPFPALGAF